MKTSFTVSALWYSVLLLVFIAGGLNAQTPQVRGPKSGSVPSGVTVTTDNFSVTSSGVDLREENEEEEINDEVTILPTPANVTPPLAPEGSNYREGKAAAFPGSRPLILKSFQGIPMTNFFPPDPILAVGPNHVIAAVNSSFRIFDKNGTVLKTINSNGWFASTINTPSVSDPIVKYDHFAKRWIFAVINTPIAEGKSYILLSVSDDDNPLGTWYNWALPGFTNGDSTVANGTDYEQVGFDSLAIYITCRQFSFGATQSFQYSKVRIIDKSKLYANTAGQLTWNDFWDFRDPNNLSVAFDGLRPYVAFGNAGAAFVVNGSPYAAGTFFTVWTIKDPISNPTVTGVDVPVVQYSQPPSPDQLGGGTPLLEGGGSAIRNDAVYRDSALWAVNVVGSGPGNAYSAVHYVKMNPFTGTTIQDAAVGQNGFWHIYPALIVDKDNNAMLTFSRSGTTEYVGAFVAGRKPVDPLGLSASVAVKEGAANYILVGNNRNRWGDYSGVALDPVEPNTFWVHSEYAAARNTWGTWVAKVKMGPLPGSYIAFTRPSVPFGFREVGNRSDTLSVFVLNNGTDTLTVTNIGFGSGTHFKLIASPTLPLKLATFDSAIVRITFAPQSAGSIADTLFFTSNDAISSKAPLPLTGTAFSVATAQKGILYATSGTVDGGRLLRVNSTTGVTTSIGVSGYPQVSAVEVNPVTKKLFGIASTGATNSIVLINSSGGDAYPLAPLPMDNPTGMVFGQDGTLFVGGIDGKIYSVNTRTGDTAFVASTGLNIGGLAFNPISGGLWASVKPSGFLGKDQIFKVDLATGATTLVGTTGLATQTPEILFDKKGKLFGIIGTGSAINSLISIDTTTGVGTIIGSMGVASVLSLASSPDSAFTGVRSRGDNALPVAYALGQNYPNPFNPTTTITYDVPSNGRVMIRVMNLLGQEVAVLADGLHAPGRYHVDFDAGRFASGVYFYEMRASSYTAIKKMVMLK